MGIAKLKEIYIPVDQLSTLPFKKLSNNLIKVNNKEEAKEIILALNKHCNIHQWSSGHKLLDFKASQIFSRENKEYFPKYLIVFGSNGYVTIYHQWMMVGLKCVITITKEDIMSRIKKLVI